LVWLKKMGFHFQIIFAIALQVVGGLAIRMASLGSSFAAGPGLPKGANYPGVLAKQLSANLTDLSVSGSTLLSMSSQIAKLPKNAEIVTVTSGGNDLGYIGGLSGMSSAPLISEQQLLGRWNDALASIHSASPNAKVYLVEYLTILGPDVKPGSTVPFNASKIERFRGVAATLLKATEQAAEGKEWVQVVPVAKASLNHDLGSAVPWVNGNNGKSGDGVAWHPNSAGMRAIAGMLYERITGKNEKERDVVNAIARPHRN
jgi:lysophospholipase L1-like esterase